MDALTLNVFESPALGILCDLEADGFRVALTADGVLSIAPRSRLTPERMQAIAAHKDAIKTLLRCCDEGVVARRNAFRAQFDAAPLETVPALLFRADVPYVPGCCFSCGEENGRARFGRCWRCSLAWRLACRLPIPADLGAAVDTAKVNA
jgi:hypothetical protein